MLLSFTYNKYKWLKLGMIFFSFLLFACIIAARPAHKNFEAQKKNLDFYLFKILDNQKAAASIDSFYQGWRKILSKDEELRYSDLFFKKFPNNFEEFSALFYNLEHDYWFDSYACLLYALGLWNSYRIRTFDLNQYYGKYINIIVTSEINSANIFYCTSYPYALEFFGKDVCGKLYYNSDLFLKVLEKRPEAEILKFFQFILSGPLQKRFEGVRICKKLWSKLIQESKKISDIVSIQLLFNRYIEIEQRASVLIKSYERGLDSIGKDREKYEQLFLDNFPCSIEELKLFGIIGADNLVPSSKWPLYSGEPSIKNTTSGYLRFFSALRYVDKKTYYNKYLNLCVTGTDVAYNQVPVTIFPLLENIKDLIPEFEKRSKKEIKQIFQILFYKMGPSSKAKAYIYKDIHAKLVSVNFKIAQIFQEAYKELKLVSIGSDSSKYDSLVPICGETTVTKLNYHNAKDRAKALQIYYQKMHGAIWRATRERYAQLFFEAFPSTFDEFKEIYFKTKDEKGQRLMRITKDTREGSILPDYERNEVYEHIQAFVQLGSFGELGSLDIERYYIKYINLALGAIGSRYNHTLSYLYENLGSKFYYHISQLLRVLTKYSEEETVKFLKFKIWLPRVNSGINVKIGNLEKVFDRIMLFNPKIGMLPDIRSSFDSRINMYRQESNLLESYEKGIDRSGVERVYYEQMFFDNFPSDISSVWPCRRTYGGLDAYCQFFRYLTCIDKEKYYNKYIDLCILKDKTNEAQDSLDITFRIAYEPLLTNMKYILSLLAKRPVGDVKSMFRCLFHGPHPRNKYTEVDYKFLYPKIKSINPFMSKLFKEAYEEVIATDDGHGH